ncbi:MAG: hypothetical protein ACK484_02120, partial [Sphingobacteriales bacterium]
REIFKSPVTDDGTKKSATGLLKVMQSATGLVLKDRVSWAEEEESLLRPVFCDGKLIKEWSLSEIKATLRNNI